MWENMTPSTELPRDFCTGIGPLQLDVVLVSFLFWREDEIRGEEIKERGKRKVSYLFDFIHFVDEEQVRRTRHWNCRWLVDQWSVAVIRRQDNVGKQIIDVISLHSNFLLNHVGSN